MATLEEQEEFLKKRREANFQKAVADMEEAARRVEEFGYKITITAQKAGK